MSNFNDIMLDLETMGNKSNAAIVSIGAVEFDIESGETGAEFYERIDLQSCLDVGLKIDTSTLLWWLKQNDEARLELTKSGVTLPIALQILYTWFGFREDKFKLWGNGARFDIGLIEDAYVACGYHTMPWDFRDERDLRTLVSFAPEIKTEVMNNFKGVPHNPIDDCKMQIEYASRIWQKINR